MTFEASAWPSDAGPAAFLRRSIAEGRILPFMYCYPPRTSYVEAEAPTDLQAVWARDAEAGADLNIYIHIPFCRYRCAFCGLYNITSREPDADLHRAYVSSVQRDLNHLAPSLRGRRVRSVFIGGGTPFAIGADLLLELLSSLVEVFPDLRATCQEITIEASPDGVLALADRLGDLVAAGVDRISIGAQSLDAEELRRAGRASAGTPVILQSLEALRDAGVSNIGTDLIVGLPGQTDRTMDRSIEQLLQFRPDTVSLYMINPRIGTGLCRSHNLATDATPALYRRLEASSARLRHSGYERDTSVQFKLPGRGGLLHKRLYFDGVSVLGLGSGARSYTAGVDYLTGGGPARTRAELATYLQLAARGTTARTGVVVTAAEAERREVILGLQALPVGRIPRAPDGRWKEPYASVFAACLDMALMRNDGEMLQLTEKGFLYRDIICWSLASDQALDRHAVQGVDFTHDQRSIVAA